MGFYAAVKRKLEGKCVEFENSILSEEIQT